jgi:alpha-mannosidase
VRSQGDLKLQDYNLQDRVDAFVAAAEAYAAVSEGRDVMFLMGTDFTYANAQAWYSNLDQLIAAVNKDGRATAFYSTPPQYLAAKLAANLTWALKVDDFFPYADGPNNFWTGARAHRDSQHFVVYRDRLATVHVHQLALTDVYCLQS